MELDVFIKELNIGIEYQGIQHFKPVKHWGGEEALKKLPVRDSRKKKRCRSFGVDLVYFGYAEDLSDDLVLNRLKKHVK